MYMSHILRYVLVAMALYGLNTSCVMEEIILPQNKAGKKTITLYFKDMSKPATRTLSDSLETAVQTIDVLAFRLKNNQLRFAYNVSVNESDIHAAADYSKKEFSITVENDDERYQYVLLANVRTEVAAYLKAAGRLNELKDAFLPNIIIESKELWNVNGTNFRRIPMWGESQGAKTLLQLDKNEIYIYRSLARVDVKINSNIAFELKEIYVYNRPSRGRMVPDLSHWDDAQKRFTAPSLPADLGIVDAVAVNGNKYTVPSGVTDFAHEIYLLETKQLDTQDFVDATCLVLGGMYNNAMNYYRVDFSEARSRGSSTQPPDFDWKQGPPQSGTGDGGMVGTGDAYHPLIRNHCYEINITGIKGKGFDRPDPAVKSISSQLVAEFLTWDDKKQDIIIDDAQYTLKITPHEVNISRTTSGEIALESNFFTSNPQAAWIVSKPSDEWFECKLQGDKITVSYKAAATPPPSASAGYFKVRLMDGNRQKVSQQIKVIFN
jgi:hypothetical protein